MSPHSYRPALGVAWRRAQTRCCAFAVLLTYLPTYLHLLALCLLFAATDRQKDL